MRFSVIIPTMNRPQSLASCLDSLEKQTIAAHQIIIAIDGKPSLEVQSVIDEYKKRLPIVQINNIQGGEHRSRDLGAEVATGDIVSYIDDDVILVPEWSAEMLKGYEEHPDAAGVGGRVINVTTYPKPFIWKAYVAVTQPLFRRRMGKISFLGLPYAQLYYPTKKMLKVDFMQCGNMSLRREVLAVHKFQGLTYYSDESDLGFQLTRREKRTLIYNSRAIAYHYPALSGGSNRRKERMYHTIEDWTVYILKNFSWKYLRLALYSVLAFVASCMALRPQYVGAVWKGIKHYKANYQNAD